jgi:hypothetical protein
MMSAIVRQSGGGRWLVPLLLAVISPSLVRSQDTPLVRERPGSWKVAPPIKPDLKLNDLGPVRATEMADRFQNWEDAEGRAVVEEFVRRR